METKEIIAIYGSPSKGRNSDSMMDAFCEGISEVDGLELYKVYINDIQIDNYTFENSCGAEGHEKEFKDLLDKIDVAEGLVISTPTYNFSVPAQLKNFIDRIRCIALDMTERNNLNQPVGKLGHLKTYMLVSGGTPNWAQKILFFAFPPFWLRGVFLYYGSKCLGAIYSGDVKTFDNKKVLKKCRKEGKKYAKKIRSEKSHGILERIFWRPPQHD